MRLDARGLLCPLPAAMTWREIRKSKPQQLEVLVNDPAAVGNITRLGGNKGYNVTGEEIAEGEWKLTLSKK